MNPRVLDALLCVRCAGSLDAGAASIVCGRCRQEYPRLNSIAVVLPQVDRHLTLWRGQLMLLVEQAEQQFTTLEAESNTPGILPDAQRRLLALAQAVHAQAENIITAFGSVLATTDELEPIALAPDAQTPLKYIHYLYRDWAWEQVGYDESQRTVAALREVVSAPALGNTLVFGAGGCRLPYELHRGFGTDETVVLDIDPFTFVAAEAVIRGQKVPMTEANLAVQEAANAARRWVLSAPAGPIAADKFHFVLANGLAPPFANGTFDTVVTPWFIDQVPPDMGTFFETLAQMLKPGGRWLNQGPLLYPTEVPLYRRHTREEIFDLAGRAGFRINKWTGESRPYLISPLNGRGRVEWVLTFEALLQR